MFAVFDIQNPLSLRVQNNLLGLVSYLYYLTNKPLLMFISNLIAVRL